MSIRFKKGYRTITFFLVTGDPKKWMPKLYALIDHYVANSPSGMQRIRCAKCFGRFDWVLEFWSESAKVGFFNVCDIRDKAIQNNILCTSSTLLLTEVASTKTHVEKTSPITSYTFIKPTDSNRFLNFSKAKVEQFKSIDSTLFWNTSDYPFTLVCEGDNYLRILEAVRGLRYKADDLIAESSTLITLGYKENDLMRDQNSIVLAEVFVKVRRFASINSLRWKGEHFMKMGYNVLERLAWYDVCISAKEKTLYDLGNKIINFKHENIESVEHTSTLLLHSNRGV